MNRTIKLLIIFVAIFFVKIGMTEDVVQNKINRCNDRGGTITYVYDSSGKVIDVLCTDNKNNEVH